MTQHSTNYDEGKVSETSAKADLRPEWGIFLPAMLIIFCISIPSFVFPEKSYEFISSIYRPFVDSTGSIYLWLTFFLIVLCAYYACTKWGDITFGDPNEPPEFKLSSWIAMIFCSGVAGAVMFWSIIEPLYNLATPPQYAKPMSVESFDWALAYLFLHWGPSAWCTYFICALPIAYMVHIKKRPFLRISSAAEPIIGKHKDGLFGRAIDIFFILGLLFCTAVTMCLSLPTVATALSLVLGLENNFALEIAILVFASLLCGITVYFGLKKGIKLLSDANVIIALAMVFYAFLVGPTSDIFDIFTNGMGKMLGNFGNMTFWTNPFGEGSFPQDWTIFYALFWAGYGPYMGMFIARISRGRTVREVIVWGMFGCIAGGYMIHGVFGSYTLWLQHTGALDAVAILQEKGTAVAMMSVISTLPLSEVVMLVYCGFSIVFLATSVNAGSFCMAATATRSLPEGAEPHRLHSTFWALAQGVFALGLLAVGALDFAKIFGNFSGALMALPIAMLTACWFVAIRYDGKYMLKHHVLKD